MVRGELHADREPLGGPAGGIAVLVAFPYSVFIMDGSVEDRVQAAGYPPGTTGDGRPRYRN